MTNATDQADYEDHKEHTDTTQEGIEAAGRFGMIMSKMILNFIARADDEAKEKGGEICQPCMFGSLFMNMAAGLMLNVQDHEHRGHMVEMIKDAAEQALSAIVEEEVQNAGGSRA